MLDISLSLAKRLNCTNAEVFAIESNELTVSVNDEKTQALLNVEKIIECLSKVPAFTIQVKIKIKFKLKNLERSKFNFGSFYTSNDVCFCANR